MLDEEEQLGEVKVAPVVEGHGFEGGTDRPGLLELLHRSCRSSRMMTRVRSKKLIGISLVVVGAVGASSLIPVLLIRVLGRPVSEFPEWWTATATAAALATAAVAAVYASAAVEREAERDARRSEQDRRAQAGSVAAWVGLRDPEPAPPGVYQAAWFPTPYMAVIARNASDLPVTVLEASVSASWVVDGVRSHAGEVGPVRLGVLPPAGDPMVMPLSITEWWDALQEHLATLDDAEDPEAEFYVDLTFRDASGLTWWRQIDGTLTEVLPT